MRTFIEHDQHWTYLFIGLLTLGAGLSCSQPEPTLGRSNAPRKVPSWYSERPVDPASIAVSPPAPEAEQTSLDDLSPSTPQAGGGPAAARIGAPKRPATQEKSVPFQPIESGEMQPFSGLPFEVPPIPAYRKPSIQHCDWIIEDGVARSRRGLPSIKASQHEGYLLGPIYRASIEARRGQRKLTKDRPVTIGVIDDASEAIICGGWAESSPRSLFSKDRRGKFEDVSIEIVGLSDSCEVRISWDTRWGFPKLIGLFNIGIRGREDSFIIRANSGVDRLIIDGCWWLNNKNTDGKNERHTSGMHIDRWRELIWVNHLWRGKRPGMPGVNLREHSAYLKSSRGGTWIVGNDLRGGNRTGFQIRPEPSNAEIPKGPIVIANNVAPGYGWNNGSDPSTYDGGSCITVWTNPNNSTYIFGNKVTDAKYGCLAISAQPTGKNWTGESGFPIGPVYIANNLFENRRGDRDPVVISSCEEVHLYANEIQGRLVLDNAWGMRVHGIRNGPVYAHDPTVFDHDIWTWNPKSQDLTKVGEQAARKLLIEAEGQAAPHQQAEPGAAAGQDGQ